MVHLRKTFFFDPIAVNFDNNDWPLILVDFYQWHSSCWMNPGVKKSPTLKKSPTPSGTIDNRDMLMSYKRLASDVRTVLHLLFCWRKQHNQLSSKCQDFLPKFSCAYVFFVKTRMLNWQKKIHKNLFVTSWTYPKVRQALRAPCSPQETISDVKDHILFPFSTLSEILRDAFV